MQFLLNKYSNTGLRNYVLSTFSGTSTLSGAYYDTFGAIIQNVVYSLTSTASTLNAIHLGAYGVNIPANAEAFYFSNTFLLRMAFSGVQGATVNTNDNFAVSLVPASYYIGTRNVLDYPPISANFVSSYSPRVTGSLTTVASGGPLTFPNQVATRSGVNFTNMSLTDAILVGLNEAVSSTGFDTYVGPGVTVTLPVGPAVKIYLVALSGTPSYSAKEFV